MNTDKTYSSKSFFSIKDKGKPSTTTKLGYTSTNRKLFGVFIAPILISYSVYILLMLRVDYNKGIFDRSANERQSLVFNKHRNKLFEADQNVIEQQINLSDMKKWNDIEVGDVIIINKDEHCPCEVLVLDFQGEHCILDMHYINGNTVYKKIKPLKVTRSQQQAKNKGSQIDFRKMLKGQIEYSRNEFDEIKGYIKLKQDPQVEQFSEENIIPRAAIIKQDWVFAIALYTGLECKQFKHQSSSFKKECDSFFLKKIEFFCLFNYVLLVPIVVQKLIFQASSTCYADLLNAERFYFNNFNMKQLFITITDALPLFPIVIYILVDLITLIEIILQNHEIITQEDNKFLRLKSLAEVKSQRKPIQSFDHGGQQNIQPIPSQSQLVTITKIPANQPQPSHFYTNFTVIQNQRDKSVSIVNHLSQNKKQNKCIIYFKKQWRHFLEFLKELKTRFQNNFTSKVLYPHFRIREPIPIADLSVTTHVIIGKTNVISYPYSSEVSKILYEDNQYKFIPDKIAQKYNDFYKKYDALKKKLNDNKQMKKLGLQFKRKRPTERERTEIMSRNSGFDKLGFSVNQDSDEKLNFFNNTHAQSNIFERDRFNDSTGKINRKRDSSGERNLFYSDNKNGVQRSYSMTNLQESPDFRSNSRSNNLALYHQSSAAGHGTTTQKNVAESIILEESNLSIKTKIGVGGNTHKHDRHGNFFEHTITLSDRLQSVTSNVIKESDLDGNDEKEGSLHMGKRGSQSLNHVNQAVSQGHPNLGGTSHKIKVPNIIIDANRNSDGSSRNRANTLQREKSHNSDYEDLGNTSNNQINSLVNYQSSSVSAVRQGRFEKQHLDSDRSTQNQLRKFSMDAEGEDEIPNEKERSFKKEYMNENQGSANQQSTELIKEKNHSSSPIRHKTKSYYKSNNLSVINSQQYESMRQLIEEDDPETKFAQQSKMPSYVSKVFPPSAEESDDSKLENQQSYQDQLFSKELIKQKLQEGEISQEKQELVGSKNTLNYDETNEYQDIPSEKVSEKMKQRQAKLKQSNISDSMSLFGEINSENSESARLKNNNLNMMNSHFQSATKKCMLNSNPSSKDKGTPQLDEKDLLIIESSAKEKKRLSTQKFKRSFSWQFNPHPFVIEETEEEQNKTPQPKSNKQKSLSNRSNISEVQIDSKKQIIESGIQKDSQRRYSLEESLVTRSSRNPSIRFGMYKQQSTMLNLLNSNHNNNSNHVISGSMQFSLGNQNNSRRNSQFKNGGVVYSEETPRNKQKSLKIDLSKIEDQNYIKFLGIINKEEMSGTNFQQQIPAEIEEQKQFQNNNGNSIESPQLGKFMNVPWEKQDSGRKSGSREFTDMNSIDSMRGGSKSRQYQLSIHSRDQENQKIERKPVKQFTFQTRQMVSSSIRQERPQDLLSNLNNESNLYDPSQNQQPTLGQINESQNNINKRAELTLQLNTSDKHNISTRNHKKSFQIELHSSENQYDPHDRLSEEDQQDSKEEEEGEHNLNYEEEEDEDDDEENQRGSELKDNLQKKKQSRVNSDLNSKNDSLNEIKSDIQHINSNNLNNNNESENLSKNSPSKPSRLQAKSTLPKLHIKRQSLELNQLSARLNLSPAKSTTTKFFGGSKQSKQSHGNKKSITDSNKSSRSQSFNFTKLQGFQDHTIPKDMDKFMEHYIKDNSSHKKQIRYSLKCIVLCHQTVTKFDIDKNQLTHTFYNEDEEMILRFAKNLGYNFKLQNLKQNLDGRYIQEYIIQIQEKIKKYEVIAFHRKKFRFSILVRRKNGADLIMREELKTVPLYLNYQRDLMAKIIHKNMQNGFRSVLISKYSLNAEETQRFVNQLGNLQTNIVKEREAIEKLFGVYEERESGMQFVTLLGVREKLKENTEIFLNSLYYNKIKTWMLTGEQYTRALSSAYLSQIIKPEDQKHQNNLINIHFESSDYDDIKYIIRRNLEKVQTQLLGEDQEKNSAFHNKDKHSRIQRKKSRMITFDSNELEQQLQFQIIIKGDVLKLILDDTVYLRHHFLFLCHFCKGFVAYEIDSDTKQILLNTLKEQEQSHRFIAITNDRGLSNTAHISIEIENLENSCPYVSDICIDSFQDLYKLIFIHGRRQADMINIILNYQIYRQMLYYIVSLITEDMYCVEGENPMNQIEISMFNYILNFFSLLPFFIQYFNPSDPKCLNKNPDENLKYYSMQYQLTRDFWSKTDISTYIKLLVVSLIQALLIFFGMDQILQSIQLNGRLIGFDDMRVITFIMVMVVSQFQTIYFSNIINLKNILYQIIMFVISATIYLSWKGYDNNLFQDLGELFEFPGFFISFIIVCAFSCMLFEIFQQLLLIIPHFFYKNLEIIDKAIHFFEDNFALYRISRIIDSKREGENTQTNHLTLLGIIRQYFTGKTEVDEIVQSMMNTGIDNSHTGISKITQQFDNPEFEEKYMKRTIGNQIAFSKIISLILFFTFDVFLMVMVIIDSHYTNSDKVILIVFICLVLVLTLMKWRYEQHFVTLNYLMIILRVGYLIAAIQVINDYDNFLIMLVFMYICYFVQLVRMDFVVLVYIFFAVYDSINFVIGIQGKFSFSKEYLSYYIINALTLITAFTYLLMAQKYQYGMMDRQQYLSANKLQLEMQKFNEVLSILLPKFIRDQIQSDNQNVVKIENQVSIIFCDIYNFDDIIAKKNVEVIRLLDNLYRAFDILCNLNGLQKIETVGKTYMACGGIVQNKLQQREGQYNEFNEVKCAINFAFEILEYSSTLTFGDDGEKIQLKIGIHFGSVIAGVIGYHKPQFSLIGDTVNTTSRVCSTSEPGTVTLSEQAYERVKEGDLKVQQMDRLDKINEKFRINDAKQKRVEAKGKGELITYQVQKYRNKKMSSPDSIIPPIRDRAKKSNDFQALKSDDSPQSDKFHKDENKIELVHENHILHEKNNIHNILLSPQQQLRQRQSILLQQQLSGQRDHSDNGDHKDPFLNISQNNLNSNNNNILNKLSGALINNSSSASKSDLLVNLNQVILGDISHNDAGGLANSRQFSNLQVTPQGQRQSGATQSINNTPDAMLKSNGSKISISYQNATILGHTAAQQPNPNNLSIPQYTQTNSILNYHNNSNNYLYSPNLLAIRAEKSESNVQELISNIDGELKTKQTVDMTQHRSHNFSITHFQELKSENNKSNNLDALRSKLNLNGVQPTQNQNDDVSSQQAVYNSGSLNQNSESPPGRQTPSRNVQAVAQKLRLADNNQSKKNISKNIANILLTMNNEQDEPTPSIDSKKPSKVHSSAESRKNTSNNTLPKQDEILIPFSNSGSVQLNNYVNSNMLSSQRNVSNGGGGLAPPKQVDTGLRKKSIFNPNNQLINAVTDQMVNSNANNGGKSNTSQKPEKGKLKQNGFQGYEKTRHTMYITNPHVTIAHNSVSTPQSKTSLHKLHQIKNLQGFSDLLNTQGPYESSGGGASSNKISGASQITKKRDERYVNSKSHTELENIDTSSKSGNAIKGANMNTYQQISIPSNAYVNNTSHSTPFHRTPLKRNTRTPESTQTQIPQQNSVSNIQNFLSKGLPQGGGDLNNSMVHQQEQMSEISPQIQHKRKSFFYLNTIANNSQGLSPPQQTKSSRTINQITTPINFTNKASSGNSGTIIKNTSNSLNLRQTISSSMQHIPDPVPKNPQKNVKDPEQKPIKPSNAPRRGSSAQNIGLPAHYLAELQNGNKNQQMSQQNSMQDNRSVKSKQSSHYKEGKKQYQHFTSLEEKSNENLFKFIPPTPLSQLNAVVTEANTQPNTNQALLINQINFQFETSPHNNIARKDSVQTNKTNKNNAFDNHNYAANDTLQNIQKSPDTTPQNKGRLTPQGGVYQRSSSNTGNHSLRSSNTPNDSTKRKLNQNDLSQQGYLNQFLRNPNAIDNQLNANLMKRMTLEKRLTEYTIRSKSNTKSSKNVDTKSPALTYYGSQQVNSQVQLDHDIEQIMEEEEQQIREYQESIISSEKKLIFFDYQDINEKIVAEGKYSLENQIDPSNLRKVYDQQDLEEELEEKKWKKKDQNDQYRLTFYDVFPLKRKVNDSEFELSKDFFAQQIQKAQDSTRIILWMWLFFYVLKTISFLIIRDKLISIFILMVVLRALFIVSFSFFIYKINVIYNMWDLKRIKMLIYGFYMIQYAFFYIETSFMNLVSQNTFSSNLQSAEQFFAFVVFTDFIFQYYSEKMIICSVFVLSEVLLSIFKDGYFRLMTLLSITIFTSIYHLIMHYIIIQFSISNFNDIRNLEFKRLLYKRFLYNLLPSHIMGQLLSQSQNQQIELTDSLENTTLLFADIAGFTKYCSGKDPEKVLDMLQKLFVQFDKACIDNEVYKVYTIGDCYVVMGTLNAKQRKPSIEAKNVIQMAFSMIRAIDEAKQKEYSDIDMRIGIHTGDIIGGVIGTDIVRYDIYGPNVLIANKMESNGERGRIMISETTYKLVQGSFPNSFSFQERQEDVIIKSLNNLQVKAYFVNERLGDNDDFIQPHDQGFQDERFNPYNPEESGEYYGQEQEDEQYYTQQDQHYEDENYGDEEGDEGEEDDEEEENYEIEVNQEENQESQTNKSLKNIPQEQL